MAIDARCCGRCTVAAFCRCIHEVENVVRYMEQSGDAVREGEARLRIESALLDRHQGKAPGHSKTNCLTACLTGLEVQTAIKRTVRPFPWLVGTVRRSNHRTLPWTVPTSPFGVLLSRNRFTIPPIFEGQLFNQCLMELITFFVAGLYITPEMRSYIVVLLNIVQHLLKTKES